MIGLLQLLSCLCALTVKSLMYHLLKQIAVTGIKTEAPPRAGRGAARRGRAAARGGARVTSPARSRSGTSTPGSCNGCELEINSLNNPYYNLEGLGIKFVASPRHADMLLVTGPVSRHMETALKRTYDATPEPKLVVAIGDCGCTGGHLRRELREPRTGVERDPGGRRGAGLPADAARDHAGDTDGDRREEGLNGQDLAVQFSP